MDLEQTIRNEADKFARTVVGLLRGLTLDEVAGLALAGASTAGRPGRKPRAAKTAAKPVAKPTPKPHLSPKLRAFRKIQGQYAGYLRGFTGVTRERIRSINASEGAAAALAEMRKLLAGTAKPTAKKPVAAKPAPKKLRMTPERKAQLKTQGTYIGLMRSLPAAQKAAMKKLRAAKGMAAAVVAMKTAAGSRSRGGRSAR